MRFVAFPATEYDEVLSGYQPGENFWGGGKPPPKQFSPRISGVYFKNGR
jgi:hypothetical protein